MGLLPLPISIQLDILKALAPPVPAPMSTLYEGKSKLRVLLGENFLDELRGKTVIDYGCGHGLEAVAMAQAGAEFVIGVDIDKSHLALAVENARRAEVLGKCKFCEDTEEHVDVVVSLDAFEHFKEPEMVLAAIRKLLKVGGILVTSWGPPWYHPKGMHLVELPPWSHIVFAEEAVLRWRQLLRGGGDTSYGQIGLNKMTIGRFERLVTKAGFRIDSLQPIPIRVLKPIHNRLTREFTTSVVQARLTKW